MGLYNPNPFGPVGALDQQVNPGATSPFAPPPAAAGQNRTTGFEKPYNDPYAQQDPFAGFPPEVLVGLLGTQGDIRDLSTLEKQIEQAQALRDRAGPGMRGEGGRVQTAAHWTEHLGHGLQQYAQSKKAKDLEAQAQKKRDTIKGNEVKVGEEWARNRGK